MPYTMNGTGTMYYGQKNFRSDPGSCDSCGFAGEMRSYETRLWFTFFFIPIVPLGKKQILDFCPKCSRHKAMPLAQWKKMEEESIQRLGAEAASKPDNAKAALEFHQALVLFNHQAEAVPKAEELRRRFPGDYDVQFYLGIYLHKIGRAADADGCFARALELRPDSLPARRAVGVMAISVNDLSRARRLLSFMEQSGPDQDPAVLIDLAYAYQKLGEHGSALDLFRVICRDFPQLAKKDKRLRRPAALAQATQGGGVSILPRAALNRTLAWTVGIVAIILCGLLALQWYRAEHQTLFLVNGFSVPVAVDIPSAGQFVLLPRQITSAVLPEGSYQAAVTMGNAQRQTVPFRVSNSPWQRFKNNRTFIFNAGGGAAILQEVVTYSTNPDASEKPAYTLSVNSPFMVLQDVDYAFREFPAEINLPDGRSVRKRRVSQLSENIQLLPYIVFSLTRSFEQTCSFSERHLAVEPVNEGLLAIYGHLSASAGCIPRALAFIKPYLRLRPVRIPWHRCYQVIKGYQGRADGLAEEYDQLLGKEPASSALLYLRGRIEPLLDKALDYFDRSIAADSANPYPWFATAYNLAMRGNFKAAEPFLLEATRLHPGSEEYSRFLREVRLGSGNLPALEVELKTAWKRTPHQRDIAETMLELLARTHRSAEMAGLIKGWTRPRPERRDEVPLDRSLLEIAASYIRGDLEGYLKKVGKVVDPEQKQHFLFEGYLSLGKLNEADALLSGTATLQNADCFLQLGLGWSTIGRDAAKGRPWLEKARAEYARAFTDDKVAAAILSGSSPKPLDQIDNALLDFQKKSLLYLAAAQIYAGERRLLRQRAAALNFHLTFPHFLVKSALAQSQQGF